MGGCEEKYGFLPCSTSLGGTMSLMVVYGYTLLIGANLLSDGSELLLEILDPGVIGGLVLPVLGALPDTLIVIFSGLGATSHEEAKEQIAVGVGTLAGSTIMLLTIATGGSVLLGRCDLSLTSGRAIDKKLTRPRDFQHTGVTTDRATLVNAVIMVMSCVLYATVQIPTLLGTSHAPRAALAGGVICLIMLGVYCTYQIMSPELQRRKMERARKKRLRRARAAQALGRLDGHGFGSLFSEDGTFNKGVVEKLFSSFDQDQNGFIDREEMRAFVIGLALPNEDRPEAIEEDVSYWMREFDTNEEGGHKGLISCDEFAQELERWVRVKMGKDLVEDELIAEVVVQEGDHEQQLLDVKPDDDDDTESVREPMTPNQVAMVASTKLFLGTLVCALFSDPMVDTVSAFSKASHIPAFFIAFVVTPFASNSSELVSSLKFAAKKKLKNISLTFSQIYGAVTLNATLVLGIFLLIIWYQDLSWTYTSEVAVVVAATLMVGILGMTRQTWPAWSGFCLLAMYPLTIVIVYVLDYVLMLDG